MKAYIEKGKIRVRPSPTEEGHVLYVRLLKPLEGHKQALVQSDLEIGKRSYDLPCDFSNIVAVLIGKKP